MPLYNANILSLTIYFVPRTSTDSLVVIPPTSMGDLAQAAIHFFIFLLYLESLMPLYNDKILFLTISIMSHTNIDSLVFIPPLA